MSAVTREQFEEHLFGVQVCYFEVLWSVQTTLTQISARVADGQIEVRCSPTPSLEGQEICTRLATEVIEVVFDDQRPKVSFGEVPEGPGWYTLMSQDIFKKIATEVAPWRLKQGR